MKLPTNINEISDKNAVDLNGKIEFKNVYFSYQMRQTSAPVLQDINICIPIYFLEGD